MEPFVWLHRHNRLGGVDDPPRTTADGLVDQPIYVVVYLLVDLFYLRVVGSVPKPVPILHEHCLFPVYRVGRIDVEILGEQLLGCVISIDLSEFDDDCLLVFFFFSDRKHCSREQTR